MNKITHNEFIDVEFPADLKDILKQRAEYIKYLEEFDSNVPLTSVFRIRLISQHLTNSFLEIEDQSPFKLTDSVFGSILDEVDEFVANGRKLLKQHSDDLVTDG